MRRLRLTTQTCKVRKELRTTNQELRSLLEAGRNEVTVSALLNHSPPKTRVDKGRPATNRPTQRLTPKGRLFPRIRRNSRALRSIGELSGSLERGLFSWPDSHCLRVGRPSG